MHDRHRGRRTACAVALATLLVWPAAAASQGSSALGGVRGWGPDLDSIVVAAGTRAVWRGLDLGSPGLSGLVSVGLYGHPVTASRRPTPWGVSAEVEVLGIPNTRAAAPASSRLSGTLDVSRLVGDGGALLAFIGSGYHVRAGGRALDNAQPASGVELGIGIRRLRLPIFDEPDLIFESNVLWDLSHFDGAHGNAMLAMELNPPLLEQRLHVRIGGSAHANGYGGQSFAVQALSAGLEARVLARTFGRRSLSLLGDLSGCRIKGDRTVGWVTLGIIVM